MFNSALEKYKEIDSNTLATIVGGKRDRHPIKHFIEGFLNSFSVILPSGSSLNQQPTQTKN